MQRNPATLAGFFAWQPARTLRHDAPACFVFFQPTLGLWLFSVLLLGGLAVCADYGISWDEDLSRATGMVSLRYVAEQFSPGLVAYHQDGTYPPLHAWPNREYGVAFEAPACLLERLLHLDDMGDRFRLRHLLTFLVSLAGVGAVYQLGRHRFGDWRVGLLGAAWLVLSPRLFAESFYNSKDAVFMALFAVGMCTAVRLLQRPTAGRAAWHALACAAAIDVRVMALLLPGATLGVLALRAAGGYIGWSRAAQVAGIYVLLLSAFVVAGWPYLWAAPWANLKLAIRDMSVYGWENTVLYRGRFTSARALPWHYAPVWIGITTPLPYIAAALVGLVAIAGKLNVVLRPRRLSDSAWQDLLFAGLLLGPLLAVIVLKSVLYDGWRHLYFVYPALLLVALRGWVLAFAFLKSKALPYAPPGLVVGTAACMAVVAYQLVAAHPNQQVYFNCLAGPHVGTRYELDYWGLSFRQGLEYVVAHDARLRIRVMANPEVAPVARLNWHLLPAGARQRITFTQSAREADYFLTNYRWHPQPYAYPHEVHQVKAGGLRILSVFKLKP